VGRFPGDGFRPARVTKRTELEDARGRWLRGHEHLFREPWRRGQESCSNAGCNEKLQGVKGRKRERLRFRLRLARRAECDIFTQMDEYNALDATLNALADPTRRAILSRLAAGEARVTDIASPFPISLNSVSIWNGLTWSDAASRVASTCSRSIPNRWTPRRSGSRSSRHSGHGG
jgi:hypothetical protein